MKIWHAKIISLILAFIFTALLLVNCGDKADTPTSSADTTAAAENTETQAETELKPDLPDVDYGGKTFEILTAGNWSNDWTEIYDFTADEQDGTPVNDAVYLRNRAVEAQFNITIKEINNMGSSVGGTGKGGKFIEKSVMAGDNAYEASQMGAYDVSVLAYKGFVVDLNSVKWLNLQNPWWDQKANSDLTIRDMMFYTTGDISTLDNDCTFCILFNKKLIADNSLDDPYTLVRDGSWTIDKFVSMAGSLSRDLNGDSKMDQNDMYGFCIWQDSMMGMVNAAGEKFATINQDGNIELTLNTEKTVNMLDKYIPLAYDRNLTYSIYHSPDEIEKMFANDQVMFYTRYLCIIKKYRNMDTDFGLLPYPKYDESQESYYHTVAPYGCSFICVPMVVEDLEMSGAILEAMAYESVDTVTKAYYDITLEGKTLRDEESTEVLDIILKTRVFDIGQFYQIGTYNERIMDLFRKNDKDFASMYAKHEAAALKLIGEINEAFAAIT